MNFAASEAAVLDLNVLESLTVEQVEGTTVLFVKTGFVLTTDDASAANANDDEH